MLDSISKGNFIRGNKYLNELSRFKEKIITFELIIFESTKKLYLSFENKQILPNNNTLGNLYPINKMFYSCYLGEKATQNHFENLLNSSEVDYSRYIFFYVNYLIEQKNLLKLNKF